MQRKMQREMKQWRWAVTQWLLTPLAAAGLLLCASVYGLANPADGTVTAGTGVIRSSGATTTITQTSDKLAVNWQSFSIGSGETVNFVQPSSASIVLNRVIGSDASAIYGSLNANGRVFLINPNGILFSSTAQVNVGGIVAATLNLSDHDFLAGNYTFGGDSKASVVNRGMITAGDGGYVALLGSRVGNDGVIVARQGTVALGAGNEITLDFAGDGLLSLTVDRGALNALAENKNLIETGGGRVLLTARAADSLTTAVVNNSGMIRAQSISTVNGEIILDAGANGTAANSGTLDASGTDGGEIGGLVKVLGDTVNLNAVSRVDVSGDSGGGTALIGGNYRGSGTERNATTATVAATATINADALTNGDGGAVVVWADNAATFNGTVTARGGSESGDGGNIETAGHKLTVGDTARVNTTAVNGATGNWLLDPADFTIAASGGDITGATLSGNLATGNITILSSNGTVNTNGSGDIHVNDALGWTGNTILTLSAANNIDINFNITASGNTAGLVLTSSGGYSLGNGAKIILSGSHPSLIINGNTYQVINNNAGNTNSLSGITLGNTHVYYALGEDLILSGSFTPIGFSSTPFSGNFDGLGHTIDNLNISASSTNSVGLFGYSSGTIRNLGVTGVSVSGQNYVGGLVGYNTGTITNCYSTGSVGYYNYGGGLVGYNTDGAIKNCYSTCSVSGLYGAGGLVSYSTGTITNCYSTGLVKSTDSSYAGVGGLVGDSTGTITNCYSSGSVISYSYRVGGLVGYNTGGAITSCYSTGSVIDNYNNSSITVGGLVGRNDSGTIEKCYSSGSVTTSGGNVGGLVGQQNGGAISNCYSTGSVSVNYSSSGSTFAGGLVGLNKGNGTVDGTITYCYSTGSVNVTNSSTGSSYSGGLVGYNQVNGTTNGTITDCYRTGSVSVTNSGTGSSYAGGLVGYNTGIITDCYWNNSASSLVGIGGGTTSVTVYGKIMADLMKTATYASWTGFSTNWGIFGGYSYPYLSWQQTVTGTVSGASSGTSVTAAINGTLFGTATTYGSGSYFFILPGSKTVTTGDTILVYVDNNSITGSYVYLAPNASNQFSSLNITNGTTIVSGNGALDVSGLLKTAVGNLNDADIPYSVSGAGVCVTGNLNVTASGAVTQNGALTVTGTTALTATGNDITLTQGGNDFQGEVDVTGTNVSLTDANGIKLGASAIGGRLAVMAGGAITQNGALIVSGTTELKATNITLNNDNNAFSGAIAITGGEEVLVNNSLGTILNDVTVSGGLTVSATSSTMTTPTLAINGAVSAAGDILLSAKGNLTIASGGSVTSSGGNATLVSNGHFINNSGADAVSAGSGKRWLIYSTGLDGDTRGNLSYDFSQYGTVYGGSIPDAGNGFSYSETLILTAALTSAVTKTYDGATAATVTADQVTVSSNLKDKDAAYSLDLTGSNYATQNVGAYIGVSTTVTVTGVTDGNQKPVYGYAFPNGSNSDSISAAVGIINPAVLTVTADNITIHVGQSVPDLTYRLSGLVGEDTAGNVFGSLTAVTAATDDSPAGVYAITLSPGALLSSNYTVNYINGELFVIPVGWGAATLGTGAGYRSSGIPDAVWLTIIGPGVNTGDFPLILPGQDYF